MKTIVLGAWIIGLALATSHLLFLAGSDIKPRFWPFALGLLFCYSVPFFILLKIQIPKEASFKRGFTLGIFALSLAISLLFPLQRFFPHYRPSALEALVYLFVPSLQFVFLSFFLAFCRGWKR